MTPARRSLALLACAGALAGCAGTPAALGPREPLAFDPDDRIDYAATECARRC
jgi:hypothetical protein